MIIALLTVLGVEFELVLRRKGPRRPSLPPPTFTTTAEPVAPTASGPGIVSARPALRIVRGRAA